MGKKKEICLICDRPLDDHNVFELMVCMEATFKKGIEQAKTKIKR